MAHLGRIALRHDPQGRFTLLSEVDWPADAGPDTEVTIRSHPTWAEWSLYMIEKSDQRIGHALTLRLVDELGPPVDPPSA